MRAKQRAAPAVLIVVAALALIPQDHSQAAAPDRDRFAVLITPTVTGPGERLMLTARGCRGDTKVSSGIFDTLTLHERSGVITTTVDRDARPGAEQQVRFDCADGARRTIRLTIAGGTGRDKEPPQHGVRAGIGSSPGGFDLQQIAVGTLLLAGALGLAYRRSRRYTAADPPAPGP